jgi:hypothetical protein
MVSAGTEPFLGRTRVRFGILALLTVGTLLRYRQIWGASIGQFAGNTTLVFFVTWFPTYLAAERHLGWVRWVSSRFCRSLRLESACCSAVGCRTSC